MPTLHSDTSLALPQDVQLVVFDLDGTLYNKHLLPLRLMWACRRSISLLAAERKARKQLKGQYFGNEATFYSALFAEMAVQGSTTEQCARAWYMQVYMPAMVAVLRKHYRADAYLVPLLPLWHKQGKRLVVFSDYGEVENKLRAIGIEPSTFDGLFSAPALGGLKPAPKCLQAILQEYGIAAAKAVVIGDRPDTDGAVAAALGVDYIFYKAK